MKQSARWIWQKTNYPHFTYDAKSIEPLVQSISREQGYLIAFTRFLNDETLRMRQWESLSSEVLNSSAIEGEILNRESVRASVGRKLGLANIEQSRVIDTHTDGIIDILIDANTHYEGDLTLERLFGWHNALFPRGYSGFEKIIVADFRGSSKMEVVSGAIGREKVHYVAPPSDTLKDEMNAFLNWFNKQDSTLIKAAIAHLWFVVIHPFDDGNGRITRAITDLVLSKIECSNFSKLYSMSTSILKDRQGYYEVLDATTGLKPIKESDEGIDITIWIEWFLKTLLHALEDAKKSLGYIIDKTKFWDNHRNTGLNAREIKMLNKVLDIGMENFEGGITKRKYIAITKSSPRTAVRDLKELVDLGCIRVDPETKGKNTRYEIII
ncbi:MAG: Fic family protein [Sulfurospirillum sp.]